MQAVREKGKLADRYREAVKRYETKELWLVLVVEWAFGLDLWLALQDQDGALTAALGCSGFDGVFLLARGPWGYGGLEDLRMRYGHDVEVAWKWWKLWPVRACLEGVAQGLPALG